MAFLARLRNETGGSALLEFAIVLPLLVVFIVGIYDFSGAFNQKQKIEHAAQLGAISAAAQPMTDIDPLNANPDSLQPVVAVIFNSLQADNVLPQGICATPPGTKVGPLKWQFSIPCGTDPLIITIDRGSAVAVTTDPTKTTVSTAVNVSYPYHWKFNSVIQLLVPGASYAATTDLNETATVYNQM